MAAAVLSPLTRRWEVRDYGIFGYGVFGAENGIEEPD